MAMVEQNQVWVGSEDSVIYIISIHSMSCNKQLTEHRASVTGLAVRLGTEAPRYGGPLGWGQERCGRPAVGPVACVLPVHATGRCLGLSPRSQEAGFDTMLTSVLL